MKSMRWVLATIPAAMLALQMHIAAAAEVAVQSFPVAGNTPHDVAPAPNNVGDPDLYAEVARKFPSVDNSASSEFQHLFRHESFLAIVAATPQLGASPAPVAAASSIHPRASVKVPAACSKACGCRA